jgi:hypothetical protein
VEAQIGEALVLKYLVTRDRKTGKFIRVGPALARNSKEQTIEVWEKDPSIQAFADLMNRALDKPQRAVCGERRRSGPRFFLESCS